jgi:hypothetical protein
MPEELVLPIVGEVDELIKIIAAIIVKTKQDPAK